MNKIEKIITYCFLAVMGIILIGIASYIIVEDNKTKNYVYCLLEKETLTSNEKEIVKDLTDPDVAKELYVVLDEEHARLFKKHFGVER